MKKISMFGERTCLLLTLPIEFIYHILDNLDELTILLSCRDVCLRLNIIIDSYYRYQVMFLSDIQYSYNHPSIILFRHALDSICPIPNLISRNYNILVMYYEITQ